MSLTLRAQLKAVSSTYWDQTSSVHVTFKFISKEFEVAVIIPGKFVALLFVPRNKANSCRPHI